MVYLTRRVTFNAAHKLYVDQWTAEQNREAFGKCANANWHGHNYQLFVTVKGQPDPVTGFVMDAKKLGELIKEEVSEVLDHSNLNLDIPWLSGKQPTSENLAVAIWSRLSPKLDTCQLHCIRLVETENISVEYYGE
jgi:6-pyruvoyltetrahydropterin/6-carboxytetrahydropterin synthase